MEPIAIVGMACRFPGGADDPAGLWRMLEERVDAIGPVPAERWDHRKFYDPEPSRPGKTYAREGGFLRTSIWDFDAHFFGISPREASILDPQQRLALEVAFEAIEDAGLALEPEVRARTGVYMGAFSSDNVAEQSGLTARALISSNTATSHTLVMISNRIAHALDLGGPAMTVDTACSSSLVAAHLGCRALWAEEVDVALVGGATAIIRPEFAIAASKAGLLSPTSRCRAFAASADGYVRGEGAGILVLKRLSRAQADGDIITALILGTGVNQDGRTATVTAPSFEAQRRLIVEVLERAGVAGRDVRYVEAHGPGTQMGDPIEAAALGATYGQGRAEDAPLWVGSVKTNIGHLEAAAGVAGLIKAAMTLRRRRVLPNLHFDAVNPKIDLRALRLAVPTESVALEGEAPLLAAVNSFGYGGTNAHAVLAEAPRVEPATAPGARGGTMVFPISARDPAALAARARALAAHLRAAPGQSTLEDLGFTLGARRLHLEHRLGVLAANEAELIEQLEAFAGGAGSENDPRAAALRATLLPVRTPGNTRPAVFVYPGMGAQSFGMGQALYAEEPVFREAIEASSAAYERASGVRLRDWFRPDATPDPQQDLGAPMTEPRWAQPANLAMQVALTELLRSRGLQPAAVLGHSVGELAAAWAAGALSLERAFAIIAARSRLQQSLVGRGTMLAAALSPLEALAAPMEGLTLAAVNGHQSVTFAGARERLVELEAWLTARGTRASWVRVAVAYHSSQMDPIEEDFRRALDALDPDGDRAPRLRWFASHAGEEVCRAPTIDDWWANVRGSVLFLSALLAAIRAGFEAFVEVGPRQVLGAPIHDAFRMLDRTAAVVSTGASRVPEALSVSRAVAEAYARGIDVDWRRAFPGGRPIALPRYPWQKKSLWTRPEATRRDLFTEELHPLVHQRTEAPKPSYETELSATFLPYLWDHRVAGAPIYPAACHVVGLLEVEARSRAELASTEAAGREGGLAHVTFDRPVELTSPARLHYAADPTGFEIFSRRAGGAWVPVARAERATRPGGLREVRALEEIRARLRPGPRGEDLYEALAEMGLEYGERFRVVQALDVGSDELLAELVAHPSVAPEIQQFGLHPTLLDGAFHALLGLPRTRRDRTFVPVGVREVARFGPVGTRAWVHARIRSRSDLELEADLAVLEPSGELRLELLGVRFRVVAARSEAEVSYAAVFQAEPCSPERRAHSTRWVVLGDARGVTPELAARAERGGATVSAEAPPRDLETARARVAAWAEAGVSDVLTFDALSARPGEGRSATHALAHLLRALAEAPPARLNKLTVVTRGAVRVGAHLEPTTPEQAPLVGLTRVASLELGRPSVLAFDLDPEASIASGLPALVEEVFALSRDDQVALRAGARWVPRLRAGTCPHPRAQAARIDPEVTHLVTGGLGGLGLQLARALADAGATHLALVGRRGVVEGEAAATLKKLEARGVEVRVFSADVADREALRRVIEAIDRSRAPLGGVVHAAGILEDATLANLEVGALDRVFAPKTDGAENLDALTASRPLGLFLACSSIASTLGNPGQASYVAANVHLEAIVERRAARGQAATFVQFGPIADVGWVAGRPALGAQLERVGLALTPARTAARRALELATDGALHGTIGRVTWSRWKMFSRPGLPRRFDGVLAEAAARELELARALGGLEGLSELEREGRVREVLVEEIAKVSGLVAKDIDPEVGLERVGLDSLMALELVHALRRRLQVDVSTFVLFKAANLNELSKTLVSSRVEASTPAYA